MSRSVLLSVCHAPAPPQAPPVLLTRTMLITTHQCNEAMISSDANDGVRFCVLEYAIPGSVRKDPKVEYILALTACAD